MQLMWGSNEMIQDVSTNSLKGNLHHLLILKAEKMNNSANTWIDTDYDLLKKTRYIRLKYFCT